MYSFLDKINSFVADRDSSSHTVCACSFHNLSKYLVLTRRIETEGFREPTIVQCAVCESQMVVMCFEFVCVLFEGSSKFEAVAASHMAND